PAGRRPAACPPPGVRVLSPASGAPALRRRPSAWSRPVFYLGPHTITLAGAVPTTSSAITLLFFWAREAFSARPTHPYAGILFFLVLPAVFVVGLLLIPLGIVRQRRRLRRRGGLPHEFPRVDLREPVVQKTQIGRASCRETG